MCKDAGAGSVLSLIPAIRKHSVCGQALRRLHPMVGEEKGLRMSVMLRSLDVMLRAADTPWPPVRDRNVHGNSVHHSRKAEAAQTCGDR